MRRHDNSTVYFSYTHAPLVLVCNKYRQQHFQANLRLYSLQTKALIKNQLTKTK